MTQGRLARRAQVTDCDIVGAPLGESRDVLHRRRLIMAIGARDAEPIANPRAGACPVRIRQNAETGIREKMLGDIPEDVLRFLTEKIDSVPHLEALLLLSEGAAQSWTVEQIAARIYTSQDTAALILKNLQHHRLVIAEAQPRYRYDASWDEGGLMIRVAETYRRHLVQVASFIHSKAPSSVREFARAFDFKKDR